MSTFDDLKGAADHGVRLAGAANAFAAAYQALKPYAHGSAGWHQR